MMNKMNNIFRSVELENYLKQVDVLIDQAMISNNNFISITDAILEIQNRARNLDDAEAMRKRSDKLVKLIKVMDNIEQEAIKIKDYDLMWKCESRKAKMINQMQLLHNKYDF